MWCIADTVADVVAMFAARFQSPAKRLRRALLRHRLPPYVIVVMVRHRRGGVVVRRSVFLDKRDVVVSWDRD